MNFQNNEAMREANPNLNAVTGGVSFSAATVIYIFVSLAVGIIINLSAIETGSDAFVYLSYIAAPLALAPAVFGVMTFRKIKFREAFPLKCHTKYYLIAVLLIFGLLFSLGWVNDVTIMFFKLFGYVPRTQESYFPDITGWKIIPAFIVIAVLPAIFEEALFRGLLLNSTENGVGSIRAIFIVGFCFSLFHGSPEQTVYQFISGCVFAFVAVRSRSIMPSVLMHFINNGLLVILYACGAFSEDGSSLVLSQSGNITLICVSAACFVGGFVWLILDKTALKKTVPGEVKNFFIFASVGILLLAVIWISNLFGVG